MSWKPLTPEDRKRDVIGILVIVAIVGWLITSPAHAYELFPSEEKRIANLEAHMVAVQAQTDEHIANIQAQIDLITAIANRRWDAYLAKCTVPYLMGGLGCPPKPTDGSQ